MTDPISHALALAHAARRGRDDGGPVDDYGRQIDTDATMPVSDPDAIQARKDWWDSIQPMSPSEALGQTWPAHLARSIVGAATLPGDVATGKIDPMSDEGIHRAADLAGLPMMGGTAPTGALAAGAARRTAAKVLEQDAAERPLLGLHNTRPDRLEKADQLGGFAVPSLAVVNPNHGFSSFGDVSLIAPKELVTPGKGNPVFASDVYSPRFPSLNDEGTKIFRGFTDMGNRRYAPLTLDNVVREMKGDIRGGEGGSYGAGSVRSGVTPQFRNIEQMQAARDKIVPRDEFMPFKEEANNRLMELADQFHPYSIYSGGSFSHANDFADMLKEAGMGKWQGLRESYRDLPPELMDKARDYMSYLRNMPTEYFEAKPQRGVGINEFAGAIVPEAEIDRLSPILQRNKINRVETYPAGDQREEARRALLKKFMDHSFETGGAVETAKAILTSA